MPIGVRDRWEARLDAADRGDAQLGANEDEWTVPIGTFVNKVVDIAGQKVSFQGGPRDTAPN